MAHTVATMLSDGKGERPRITDFLLSWAPKRRQSAQDQLAIFRALASRTKD